MYTADTNVIIYYLQDDSVAADFFESIIIDHIPVYVSGVTETEVLCYPPLTEKDIQAIEDALALCTTIHTNSIITRQAAELRRKYGVKTMDALIAATALFTNSTLVTRNVRDFKRIPELSMEAI